MSSSKRVNPKFARTSRRDRDELIISFLERLNTPRSLAVALCFKYNAHFELVSLPDVDFESVVIHGAKKLALDYQATRLLAKCTFLKLDIDRREAALRKESEAESHCSATNKFFKGSSTELYALRESLAFRKAKRFIATLLGDLVDFIAQCDEGVWDPGWTPGRNTVSYGNSLSSADKFSAKIECTAAASGFVLRTIQRSPLWGMSALAADGPCSILFRGLNIVEGNVLTVVPKNAKTDRVICYEPNGNIWVQKMVGDFIRARLKRHGCDLSDQSRNQLLAKLGSIDGSFSTIDLSSASDSLCIEAVFELLPLDWASFLDKLRSKATSISGSYRRNEKFSSMGNGFTFELESLIFLAIAQSFSGFASVYGDDIIVRSNRADRVIEALATIGFKTNSAKTFTHGPFRESCGGDFMLGALVTPIYIRHANVGWSMTIHNQIRARFNGLASEDEYSWLKRWRIEDFPLGPSGYGDGHYHSNLDEASPKRARHGWEGWYFRSISRLYRTNRRIFNEEGDIIPRGALVASVAPKAPLSINNSFLLRDRSYYKSNRTLASSWPEVLVY